MPSFVSFVAVCVLLTCRLSYAAPMENDDGDIWSLAHHGWSTPPDSPQTWRAQQPLNDHHSTSGSASFAQGSSDHWTHGPADHSLSWATDVSSAPQQLEDVDYEILQALSADLSSTSTPREKKTRLAKTSVPPDWPEPPSFRHLQQVPALKDKGHVYNLLFKNNAHDVQQAIASNVFAGKLHWVDPHVFHRLTDGDFRGRWPYQVPSRVLPVVRASANDGTPLRILMTQHNLQTTRRLLKGTVLENKPYYMFWGVPESSTAERPPLVHFGAGYVENDDFKAIDDHLRPLLGLASGGRAHV